jgi:hypothetical protein
MIGEIAITVGDDVRRFAPLSVRQLCTMQNVLAERMAQDAAQDAQRLGLSQTESVALCRQAREDARLSTALVRSCFTLEGALRIVTESTGAERVDAMLDGVAPDDITDLALRLVGFEWDDTLGKWVRRARVGA